VQVRKTEKGYLQAKNFVALVAVLTMMSVFAAPAFAQEQSVMIENSGANVALQLLNIGGD
jgi:hypothetical protein